MKLGSKENASARGELAKPFPHLATHGSLFARYGVRVMLGFAFLSIASGMIETFWTATSGPRRASVWSWIEWGGKLGIYACLVVAFALAWRAKRELAAKGYGRLAKRLILFRVGLSIRRRLLARIPPFSEIEHTPYNKPSDPDALLRMLDDLAAQMDAPPAAAPRP